MDKDHTAFISIGSNKGDKRHNLEKAIQYLSAESHTDVAAVSSFYRTDPLEYKDQDWFVNAAVKITTNLDPVPLLEFLQETEKTMDKKGKEFRYGPRIIDLDIVYYDDLVFDHPLVTIPHPKMHERCFVLQPLYDIGPGIRHPLLKLTTGKLLDKIKRTDHQVVILLNQKV